MDLLKTFMAFMKARKLYWLAPLILILMIFGIFLVFAETSAIAPFIYTLF
jgi:hypothetical protein